MTVTLFNEFDRCYSFLLSFVREHRTESAVTNDADMRVLGSILLVNDQAAFVVNLQADVFKTQAGSVRPATNSYKNDVGLQLYQYF
jgi:hypothetical protein